MAAAMQIAVKMVIGMGVWTSATIGAMEMAKRHAKLEIPIEVTAKRVGNI